ncbi:MAG: metallophosphoesterase family protein [Spirochaetales bacterium]|nr:metallophosphoesterase family protein [Spirochaetales bacterium]
MKYSEFHQFFRKFLSECPEEELDPARSYVFLSDLHMGNGGSRDDLVRHRALMENSLAKWYLEQNYILVLNGDIEDSNKFLLHSIRSAWKDLLEIFGEFAKRGNLRKIVGNHDYELLVERNYPWKLYEGLVFKFGSRKIFAFHGHQASNLYVAFDFLSRFLIRWFLRPLHIRNITVSRDSRRRFRTEKRIYRAALDSGIVAVAGHTHRPLFESMSKFDHLKLLLENLLSVYVNAPEEKKEELERQILLYRREMEELARVKEKKRKTQSLYGDGPFLLPCLFNSGSATSKNGFNALEIRNGIISLVYWTEGRDNRPYILEESRESGTVDGRFFRYTLQSDALEAVFTRLELLGDFPSGADEPGE